MPRNTSLSIAIGIAVIVLTSFIATQIKGPHYFTLLWRRARYNSITLSRPYRAPMTECNTPYTILQSYRVYLHHGCSLAEHKKTIGDRPNLDTNIKYIFPDGPVMGQAYVAENIDDAALDDIRADIVVDLVTCERGGELGLGGEVEDSYELDL